MSRVWAIRALWTLVVLFILGAIDYLTPLTSIIPGPFVKLAAATLIGVAIGSILQGLRSNGAASPDANTGVLGPEKKPDD